MSKSKTNARPVVALDDALLVSLKPLIAVLDEHASTDAGHELPSRSDKTLSIMLSNLCRDTYQQIYGMPATKTFAGFGGVKDSWDRAQAAIVQLVQNYGNNPQDMEADPNFSKFATWEAQAQKKFEVLSSILDAFKSVYRTVTGQDWQYVAPGTSQRTAVDKDAALARFKQINAGKAGLAEGSKLIAKAS